jgi:hypothetical protein
MKKIVLSFILIIAGKFLSAQTAFNCTYTNSIETAPYNSIGVSGNGSFSTNLWDNAAFINSVFITGGFNFNGTVYTTCSVHSDGYIWFGGGGPPASGAGVNNILALPSLGTGNTGVIAAFARDLNEHPNLAAFPVPPNGGFGRRLVQWNTIGFGPNRYTAIEFIGFFPKVSGCGGQADHHRVDFQIRLYENNPAGINPNRIEIFYRDQTPFCNDQPYSFQIGIRGQNPTDYICRTQASGNLTPGSSSPGTSPSDKINFLAGDHIGPGTKIIFDYNPSPVISPGPTVSNICPANSVNLTSSFSGNIRWYKDGSPINGAAGATQVYTATSSGVYKVIYSEAGCEYESSPVTVNINSCGIQIPVITTQPAGLVACLGDDVQLTVSATGNPVLTYQWRKNEVPLPGETTSVLSLSDIGLADAGDYDVVVTNNDGSVTSEKANLQVQQVPAPPIEHR